MLSFNTAVTTFLSSSERGLQLDFFRKNGEVLLQVFKGVDVKSWPIDIGIRDSNCVVFQLLFNKQKTGNSENLKRFLEEKVFRDYEKVDFHGQNAYFKHLPISFDSYHLFEEEVQRVVEKIYCLDFGEVEFTLNAY